MRHSVIPRHTKDARVSSDFIATRRIIFYPFPLEKQTNIDLRSLMIMRNLTRGKFPLQPPHTLSLSARNIERFHSRHLGIWVLERSIWDVARIW